MKSVMKNVVSVASVVCAIIVMNLNAAEIFVNPVDGNDANAGDAFAPLRTLQSALSQLTSGDTLKLSAGVYQVTDEIVINGLQNVTICGEGKELTFIEPTEAFTNRLMSVQNCSRISFSGITFQNANYQIEETDLMGGAILVKNSTGIDFFSCNFFNNTILNLGSKNTFGGAIAAYDSFLNIRDCQFDGNLSRTKGEASGGAVSVVTSSHFNGGVICSNSIFTANTVMSTGNWSSTSNGGAVFVGSNTTNEFTDCLFAYNDNSTGIGSTYAYAGGVYGIGEGTFSISGTSSDFDAVTDKGFVHLKQCTFANNVTDCAISTRSGHNPSWQWTTGELIVEKCLFYGHRSLTSSSIFGISTSGTITFTNCFYDQVHPQRKHNKVIFSDDCVQGDPMFLPDLSVPQSSLAYGYGRRTVPMAFTAKTWYVDPEVSGGDGSTSENALDSLSSAYALARDGDTIKLAPGSYTLDKEKFPLDLTKRKFLTICGSGSDQTFLESGEGTNTFIVAIFNLDKAHNIAIKGLTIRDFDKNGKINDVVQSTIGIGINVYSSSRILLQDIVFENCRRHATSTWASNDGAISHIARTCGIIIDQCKMRNNIMNLKNYNSLAGLLKIAYGYGIVSRCEFTCNTNVVQANLKAQALYIDCGRDFRSKWEVRNCLFAGNVLNTKTYTPANIGADDIWIETEHVSPLFDNCTIIGSLNKAFPNGLNARNCIFQNCGAVSGNKAYVYDSLIVTNEAFVSGSFALHTGNYTSLGCAAQGIPSNVVYTADAKFKNPAKGDYRLTSESPAMNLGAKLHWMEENVVDPNAVDWFGLNQTDLVGNPRIRGKRPDAGCIEAPEMGMYIIVR